MNSDAIPSSTGNGNKVLVFALCNILLRLNFKLEIIFIDPISKEQIDECRNAFEPTEFITVTSDQISSQFSFLQQLKSTAFNNKYGVFFKESDIVGIKKKIAEKEFDFICAYDIRPILTMNVLEVEKPKIAFMVDLLEHFYKRRWELWCKSPIIVKIRNGFSFLSQQQNVGIFYNYLQNSSLIIEHAYNHFIELQNKGFRNVVYLPHPLPIQKINYSREETRNKILKVLIIGSFKGVASQLGHALFLNEVLPKYEALNKHPIDTEFRFVGHGTMMQEYKEKIDRNEFCKYIGYVADLESEWKFADIILVTIPIEHGFRTRIAEAMSYGKCIIAHIANSKGMPELINDHNCILAKDGEELAQAIYKLKFDFEKRRFLAINALDTFNSEISSAVATQKLKLILNKIGL